MPTKIFLHAWLDFQSLFWLKFPKIATNSPTNPILFFLQPLKIPKSPGISGFISLIEFIFS